MSWPRPDGPPSQSTSSLLHENQSRDSVNSTSSLVCANSLGGAKMLGADKYNVQSDTRHYNHHNTAPPTRQASLVASVSDKVSLVLCSGTCAASLSPYLRDFSSPYHRTQRPGEQTSHQEPRSQTTTSTTRILFATARMTRVATYSQPEV